MGKSKISYIRENRERIVACFAYYDRLEDVANAIEQQLGMEVAAILCFKCHDVRYFGDFYFLVDFGYEPIDASPNEIKWLTNDSKIINQVLKHPFSRTLTIKIYERDIQRLCQKRINFAYQSYRKDILYNKQFQKYREDNTVDIGGFEWEGHYGVFKS